MVKVIAVVAAVLALVIGLVGCSSADPSNLLAFTRYYGEVDTADIWVMDLDTGQERQITFGRTATKAVWYDQQHLLVLSNLSLWLVDIQGKEPTKRLTSDLYVTEVCSDPKGRYVFYNIFEPDLKVGRYMIDYLSIYRIDMTTGQHELVRKDTYPMGYMMKATNNNLLQYIGEPMGGMPEIDQVNFSGQNWVQIYQVSDLFRMDMYSRVQCLGFDSTIDGMQQLFCFQYSRPINQQAKIRTVCMLVTGNSQEVVFDCQFPTGLSDVCFLASDQACLTAYFPEQGQTSLYQFNLVTKQQPILLVEDACKPDFWIK